MPKMLLLEKSAARTSEWLQHSGRRSRKQTGRGFEAANAYSALRCSQGWPRRTASL